MPEAITTPKRNEMRECYLEHRTIQQVADRCGVQWHTAEKYMLEDGWVAAAARVDKLAEDIAVKKIGKRRADNIRVAQAAIIKMARSLDGQDSIAFNARGLNLLARLVEFLSGDPDSRPDLSRGAVQIYIPDNGRAVQVDTPAETAPGAIPVETTPVT